MYRRLFHKNFIWIAAVGLAAAIATSGCEEGEGKPPLRVYPNPNNGLFTVAFEGYQDSTFNLRVLDSQGKEVYNKDVKYVVGTNEIPVDISENPAGTYNLQYFDGMELRNIKFMKN